MDIHRSPSCSCGASEVIRDVYFNHGYHPVHGEIHYQMTITLSELKILALDCQATSANPHKGQLLEIGWVPYRASAPAAGDISPVQAYLIRLQKDTEIPHPVKRITGISEISLTDALATDCIWQLLIETAKAVAAANQLAVCPTVIHYARFEEPFLRKLHRKHAPRSSFPFLIICTHAIAVRLLPDLPRRGLRALAGYFGHAMPKLKRSADHAGATVFVWQQMVQLLKTHRQVQTLPQLTDWLAATHPPNRTTRKFPMNPEARRSLPDQPGVYRLRRSNGDLLYIGKAKSLRQRVNGYFRRKARHPEHILEMLTQAIDLDFSMTASSLEAAILESDEIKRHAPPYNIALSRRQRSLVFCTRDFSGRSTAPDSNYAIGPLPEGKLIEAMSALGAWIRSGIELADADSLFPGQTLLGASPAYAPGIQTLQAGLDNFQQKHRGVLIQQSPLRGLTLLGAQLWRERPASPLLKAPDEKTEDKYDEVEEEQIDSPKEFEWTPESVARAVENMVMHGAHMIRRARWFCLLSESSLVWTSADNPQGFKNLVVFEKGDIRYRDDCKTGSEIPVPPGFVRSFRCRQKNLDLMTYDRLRVATTEMRRLIAEGRRIELRLGPKVTIACRHLKKALQWV
jgi:DNA polymerase III subunit epsilon